LSERQITSKLSAPYGTKIWIRRIFKYRTLQTCFCKSLCHSHAANLSVWGRFIETAARNRLTVDINFVTNYCNNSNESNRNKTSRKTLTTCVVPRKNKLRVYSFQTFVLLLCLLENKPTCMGKQNMGYFPTNTFSWINGYRCNFCTFSLSS
jgi:hypothetical protein